MPGRLSYTDKARDDLVSIRLWLTQPGSGQLARRRIASIRADIRMLKRVPCLYSIGQHLGVRELPCTGGYRVLYRVHPDTGSTETAGDVRILRVFGPGQSRERM